jgi:regulator of protease activity HflC (stomatin/prohibitin superfamily)
MEWLSTLIDRVTDLFRWWVVVTPWERCLRVRCGKHVTELGAGIHLRVPLIDRVYVQSIRLRTVDTQTQTVTTKDGHALTFSGVIRYAIADIRQLYDTLHHADDTIIDLASGAAADYVSQRLRADVTPEGLVEHVNGHLDLEGFGLGEGHFQIADFAFVRTYRLLQTGRYRTASEPLTTVAYDA